MRPATPVECDGSQMWEASSIIDDRKNKIQYITDKHNPKDYHLKES